MILLDTNVLSALMHTTPDLTVAAWMDRQPAFAIWTTSITIFEIEYGLKLMPEGKRRTDLEKSIAELLAYDFRGRVAPFDLAASAVAGRLSAQRRREGRTTEDQDAMIAGIAIVRQAAIATRNVRHFEDLPIKVLDPWHS